LEQCFEVSTIKVMITIKLLQDSAVAQTNYVSWANCICCTCTLSV